MKKYAIGIVTRNRIDFTLKTLNSLYFTTQDKKTYDVFIIDNASDTKSLDQIKEFIKSGFLPIKNLYIFKKEQSISVAWNLFLSVSKDYDYRIKCDNDIVFFNTLGLFGGENKPVTNEYDNDVLRAVIASTGGDGSKIYTGVHNQTRPKTSLKERTQSNFLDYMVNFSSKNNADLISLVPVTPGQTFSSMFHAVCSVKRSGIPYLFGACMLITKKAFNMLGYFDERLERRIDIEYSQRAIKNNLNITYHPQYGVSHIGASQSTDTPMQIEDKYAKADVIERTEQKIEAFNNSVWESILPKIQKNSHANRIVILN